MEDYDWDKTFVFMIVYTAVLAGLTIFVAAFYIRDHITDVVWQSLGGVVIIMVLALFITGLIAAN